MTTTQKEEFSRRFVEAMVESGNSQAAIAKKSGVSTTKISDYANGKTLPSSDSLIAICEVLNVQPEWLVRGTGNKQRVVTIVRPYNIPLLDIRLAAGAGSWNTSDIVETLIGMDPTLMSTIGRFETEGLNFARADGDSMEPVISDGALVLFDGLDTRLREGIFAFRLGDDLRIKRLRPVGVGGIEARSDNFLYPPEIFEGSQKEHLKILGRVIWVCNRL